jgi:hypothetical protein
MPCSAFGETQQRTKTSATCYYFLCVFLIIYASTGPPGCESYYARHWSGAGSAAVLLSKSQAKEGPKSGCTQQEVYHLTPNCQLPSHRKFSLHPPPHPQLRGAQLRGVRREVLLFPRRRSSSTPMAHRWPIGHRVAIVTVSKNKVLSCFFSPQRHAAPVPLTSTWRWNLMAPALV